MIKEIPATFEELAAAVFHLVVPEATFTKVPQTVEEVLKQWKEQENTNEVSPAAAAQGQLCGSNWKSHRLFCC